MWKIYLSVLIGMFMSQMLYGQESSKTYLDVGVGRSFFQDQKYSDAKWNGVSGRVDFGNEELRKNHLRGWNLQVNVGSETPKGHSHSASIVNPSLSYFYLRQVNEKLYLGANWTIANLYNRSVSGLGNNSSFTDFSSSISLRGSYDLNIGKKALKISADVGLVSLSKMVISFAYSAPQSTLNDGKFNFQDSSIDSPSGKEGFQWMAPWDDLRIKTSIQYALSKRFDLVYRWEYRKYELVKDYPTMYGLNSLSLRYNFRLR
ncbi:hypothetical protein EYV94_09635 [Puteibacter caeruleilacunae]|nr:hypothetical protein EYV94_09635 [Puteibacter caeruleilacunae]